MCPRVDRSEQPLPGQVAKATAVMRLQRLGVGRLGLSAQLAPSPSLDDERLLPADTALYVASLVARIDGPPSATSMLD